MSNSDWGSRVVLVSKKDGTTRFCVDYRDTNSKLQFLDSPLPLTAEAINRLSAGQGNQDSLFLCTLDLASVFWGLPVEKEDRHITAFVTHRQKYEFNVLSFGIQSGPSYMCQLMDAVLQDLASKVCRPYLDDVGIWSTGTGSTKEQRVDESFRQMLQRLDLSWNDYNGRDLLAKLPSASSSRRWQLIWVMWLPARVLSWIRQKSRR